MSFCTKCGNEMPENAKFCTKCGASVTGEENPAVANMANNTQPVPVQGYNYQQMPKPENKALGICSIALALFFPVVALICGIIGVATYKEEANRKLSIIGLAISGVIIVLYIVMIIVWMNYIFTFFNPYFWADAFGY